MGLDGDFAHASALAVGLLDEGERARAERFRDERARGQFVAGRVLLRRMLAAYGGADAAAWRFRADALGKLHLDGEAPAFVFNLSHTYGLVACALARRGELGLDVEQVRISDDLVAVARHMFSAVEADHIGALAGEARAEAFFAYWTLKEAYLKARGFGLSLDTKSFAFNLAETVSVSFTASAQDDGARWRFARLAPTPGARLAVAAAAPLDLSGLAPRWIALEDCFDAGRR